MTAAPAVVAAASEGDSRALLIRKLRKEYRPGVPVLKDIDLAIPGRGRGFRPRSTRQGG
jgi:hypothetical protein